MDCLEQEDNNSFAIWAIFGATAIFVVLLMIHGTLKDIYSDTHYTSASIDYLLDIKNSLEN